MPQSLFAALWGLFEHPDRIRIITALEKTQAEASADLLTDFLQIPKPEAFRDLGYLTRRNFVSVRKDGHKRLYSIEPKAQAFLSALTFADDSGLLLKANEMAYARNVETGATEWQGDVDAALGFAPSEFPRTTEAWEVRVHSDDRPRLDEAVQVHLSTGAPFYVQYRMRKKDGNYVSWLDCGSAIINEARQPYKWVGMTRLIGAAG